LEGKRATGVTIFRYGQEETLRAEREVILAAGTYGSPQTLMLSGIGPAAQLKAFNITPVVDLPVGEDLQEHVLAPISFRSNERSFLHVGSAEDIELYRTKKQGPLSSNVIGTGAFVSTKGDKSVPDVEFYMVPAMFVDINSPPPADGFSIAISMIEASSRGKVTLRSPRADAKPRIQTNVLATADDEARIFAGIKAAINIVRQPKLAEVCVSDFLVPKSESHSDMREYVRTHAMTDRHPAGTCGIGRVVDPELKVLGIDGLRVVDASVFPTIPRGNLNAVVIAIAEKAVDLITGKTN
jgi:choline dehydrogenase